jgi:2-polyprenyl-6-hydroxyphenyl methylase/3-demethylubiquinone-9 3-methyltransferase
VGAEYVLRWLPIGTHDWNKFVSQKELKNIMLHNNFLTDEIVGMKFNLLTNKWNKSKDISVNYISTFLKN